MAFYLLQLVGTSGATPIWLSNRQYQLHLSAHTGYCPTETLLLQQIRTEQYPNSGLVFLAFKIHFILTKATEKLQGIKIYMRFLIYMLNIVSRWLKSFSIKVRLKDATILISYSNKRTGCSPASQIILYKYITMLSIVFLNSYNFNTYLDSSACN